MSAESATRWPDNVRQGGAGGARGACVLVVGPSGAGKDTLLDGARAQLAGDGRFVFPHRVVTRAADANEHNIAMTEAEFLSARDRGAFVLWWQAHGLYYGIPATVADGACAGRFAVINGSRDVVAEARARLPRTVAVLIDCPLPVRAERLALRGRESAADIAARLERSAATFGPGDADIVIRNDGTPEEGVAAFVAALRRLAETVGNTA